jgi:hypothetical protein
VTSTQFWGTTARSRGAALSCALAISLLACDARGREKHVLFKAIDADASLSPNVVPDGSVPSDSNTPPARCAVDTTYLAKHKRCGVDADCALLDYQVNCCPEADLARVAVAATDHEEVQACVDSTKVVCICPAGLTRAEDGRVVSESGAAIARCIDQKCVSSVGARDCGSRATCGAREICVTYENVEGGIPPDPDSPDNKLLTFRCVPNPCQNQLSCDCVQPICAARNDVERACEIKRNANSDVTCRAFPD